jgi:hypothetical protein
MPEAPGPEESGPDLREQADAVMHAIGTGLRGLGERLLPDRESSAAEQGPRARAQSVRRPTAAPRQRETQRRRPNWGLMAAILIPLLAILGFGGYTLYQNWSTARLYNALLQEARDKRTSAQSLADSPIQARQAWLEVLSKLQAAEAIEPDEPEISELRTMAETALDRIDGVTRLAGIIELHQYTGSAYQPSRLVVNGTSVYVLDHGGAQVFRHTLNEQRNAALDTAGDPLFLQQGQVVDGTTVGTLVDLAWMDDGGERGTGALLVLDRAGQLFEYDPEFNQFSHEQLGSPETWSSPVSLRTFDSNLYLLDPRANQVLKYVAGQYANTPNRWIAQSDSDLRTAVDMGIDGNIYVLHNSGKLEKYYGGEREPFAVTRIPRPLSGANALHMDVEEVTKYVYLADASERRIVQLDRKGTFVRQLQPVLGEEDRFRQLSAVYADEMADKLYYLAANALYVTDLPPVLR